MMNRIKAPALAAAAAVMLSGCIGDLLDVDNPNSLVEESIELPAAANGVANGSLRLVSEAVANMWEAPGVVADELYWTGSRDAWGQLDQGFIGDPLNEFTDAAFPTLGQATWMADNAVTVLQGHVDELGAAYELDLHRAQLFNGIALMVTGEIQEDMTFSDKQEDGPPVGPNNMYTVLDNAIANLDAAVTGFASLGEDDLETIARAVRARARMSRTIWDELNPISVGGALQYPQAALDDADAVLAAVGQDTDWKYNLAFTEASTSCAMCSNVNNRGENQIDQSLHTNDGPGASGREDGVIALTDPVGGEPDAAVATAIAQWGTNQYGELTIASSRLMRMILAEDALASGDTQEFEDQINALRGYDNYDTDYTYSAGDAVEVLQHHRRVNTLFMGLRLQDMYRWGLSDPLWEPGGQTVTNPGEMLPITIVECRSNQYLDNVTCAATGG